MGPTFQDASFLTEPPPELVALRSGPTYSHGPRMTRTVSGKEAPDVRDVAGLLRRAHDLEQEVEELRARNAELRAKSSTERAGSKGYLLAIIQQMKASQAELQDTQVELLESEARASAAVQAKNRFLANMSHELRTPLNAIIGYTEILQEDAIGGDRELNAVLTSSKNLLAIIDDVLDLAKIDSGRMDVSIAPVNLKELFDEIMVEFAPLFDNALLQYALEFLGPESIETDRVRVRQIVTNLLSNAIKFTHEGSVSVRVINDGPHIKVTVSDSGIGMTPEQQARVFEPFVQADATTTRRYGGTGLGLSISKSLTRQLGGRLIVHSTPGEGSTFTLTLPKDPPKIYAEAGATEVGSDDA